MSISRNALSMLLINLYLNMEHMYIFWEKIERSLQKYSVKGVGAAYCGRVALTAMDMVERQ